MGIAKIPTQIIKNREANRILKKNRLSSALVQATIYPYFYGILEKEVAQRWGISISTVSYYYKMFGLMLESEYNTLFNFYKESRRKNEKTKN